MLAVAHKQHTALQGDIMRSRRQAGSSAGCWVLSALDIIVSDALGAHGRATTHQCGGRSNSAVQEAGEASQVRAPSGPLAAIEAQG